MSLSVDFLPAAYADLVNLVDFFTSTSPELGDRFIVGVRESTRRIESNPEVGGRCEFSDVSLPQFRAWPILGFRRYLLIYRVEKTTVQIIRLLDGTSDWSTYLSG